MRPRAWAHGLVAAACGAVLLAACGGTTSAGSTRPDPSTAAPAGPSSPAAATAASEPDVETPPLSGLAGATLYGVTSDGDGLVVVGAAGASAAAWRSADGPSWQRADVASDGGPSRFRAVAAADDALLAFAGADDEVSTVWTSADGTSWEPVGAAGLAGRVNGVTFRDGRWYAVGDLTGDGGQAEGGEAIGGAVHASSDGRSWRLLTAALTGAEATVSDVAAGDGLIVVAGFDATGGVVWLDPAGGPERVADGFAAATVQGVAATDDGFVALGRGIADLQPVAWTSTDGRGWRRAALDAEVFAPGDAIHDLTATSAGLLVAVGATDTGGAVWTSTDGRTWSRHS